MPSSDGKRIPARLGAILERLGRLQADPGWQADRQLEATSVGFDRERWAKNQRAGYLLSERVPISPAMADAITSQAWSITPACLRLAQRWIEQKVAQPMLVLSGAHGCGKSVAAAAVLAKAGGKWRTATDVARIFAALFGQDAEREALLRAPLLVVDALGTEPHARRMEHALQELFDARLRARTVMTTNLTREAFDKRYRNERLASRFADRRAVLWVTDNGPDLRKAMP